MDTTPDATEHEMPAEPLTIADKQHEALHEARRKLRFKNRLIELLQKIESASDEATSVKGILQFAVDQICTYMNWSVGHAYLTTDKQHLGDIKQVKVVQDTRLSIPVLIDSEVVAVLEFHTEIRPDDTLLDMMTHIGQQLGRIIERKQAVAALVQSYEQLRSLAGRLASVREKERKRIAREVHDVLGQALTALRFDIASIKKQLPERADALHEHVDQMDASVGLIIQTVRRIASDLRPGILDDLGIVAALEWQTGEFETRSGINCSFASSVHDLSLDPDRSTALFRIFQELLTNVARHADASTVHVVLEQLQDVLTLQVKDNGRGIRSEEIADTNSLGLLGMRERLLPWQGRVDFEGILGEGTTVTVSLPLA